MEKRLIAAGLLVTSLTCFAQLPEGMSLQQQPAVCGETPRMINAIREFNESVVWASVDVDGMVVSVWINEATKSFTIVRTSKDKKTSCIIAAGEGGSPT